MNYAELNETVAAVGAELRKRHIPVTPANVEQVVNAVQKRPTPAPKAPTTSEVQRDVEALSARIDAHCRKRGINLSPKAGDTIPAWQVQSASLTPRHPDGSGGELLGTLVVEHAGSGPQFMAPTAGPPGRRPNVASGPTPAECAILVGENVQFQIGVDKSWLLMPTSVEISRCLNKAAGEDQPCWDSEGMGNVPVSLTLSRECEMTYSGSCSTCQWSGDDRATSQEAPDGR